jgi:hypothetical protein
LPSDVLRKLGVPRLDYVSSFLNYPHHPACIILSRCPLNDRKRAVLADFFDPETVAALSNSEGDHLLTMGTSRGRFNAGWRHETGRRRVQASRQRPALTCGGSEAAPENGGLQQKSEWQPSVHVPADTRRCEWILMKPPKASSEPGCTPRPIVVSERKEGYKPLHENSTRGSRDPAKQGAPAMDQRKP